MRRRVISAALLLGGVALPALAPVAAGVIAELGARAIMEKNFFVSKIKTLKSDTTMVLINDTGQQRERKNTTLLKLQPNGIDSKLLVRFSTPTDIKGTGFLQVEHSDGDDDLWIYLPALKKSRRLVANNKKDSFVGSDFSYGDISLPKVDQYQHRLLRTESIDDHPCYVIESVPINEAVKTNSGYSKKLTWVRTDIFLESKVEYYDLSGRLLKTQRVTRYQLVEPDTARWYALHREMINHQTGHQTIINFDKIEAGVAMPDDVFTTRYIERE
ncbi:MAG: outer membrane lipoprotein-sorting protein [Gammaproteobacteria bacterium]|nr:outer membrane lipoprotein-sorting protein [Gammaproteobacteria bacterium]